MTASQGRLAFAVPVTAGLALGDPTGAHVLLTPAAVEHRAAGAPRPLDRFAWATVRGLELEAAASRSRLPGVASTLMAVAAESIGLGWTPGIAPVSIVVRHDAGDDELACDGYIGHGYRRAHLDVLEAGVHVLAAHPAARARLAKPSQVLADLGAATSRQMQDARASLAQTWGATCACD